MKKTEILAPAGSMQALKAVVAAGCDAVYMGGTRFGARAYAENPDEEELVKAIQYCHLHGVKLYMTVNTLLKDEELSSLYEYFLPYYEAGVDAVLVQDMGVLQAFHRWFPDMPLHASTQMTITQGRMAEFYREYGITRIVPSRELSLLELKKMREETEAEIEVFVHGALCYSFSGQCLFSSMQGGRSGNRGRCAQPCRQQYRLEKNGKKGYFLSPKELCNLAYLGELMELGIDSLKIEGRMKRAEYAAFLTAVYKKYAELYENLGKEGFEEFRVSHPEEWEKDIRNLADFYNREGFTSGYLEGRMGNVEKRHPGERGEMLSAQRSRHGGVLVGRVLWAGSHETEYEALEDIGAQDVVEFRDREQKTLYEYTLGAPVRKGERVRARYKQGMAGKGNQSVSNKKISAGDLVYRTKNQTLLLDTEERYLNKKKQLQISGSFQAKEGEKPVLSVRYKENRAVVYGDRCEPAKNQPATEEFVRKNLEKTGESSFCFEHLEISMENNLFFSVGMIKNLRREAFDSLEQEILKAAGQREGNIKEKGAFREPSFWKESGENERMAALPEETGVFLTASVMTQEQLNEVLLKKDIRRIYLHTECMSASEISHAAEKIRQAGKSPFLVLPSVFRTGAERVFTTEKYMESRVDGYLVKNGESLLFLKEFKETHPEKSFDVGLDAGFYIMNKEAYSFYKGQAAFLTLPYELTWKEMEKTAFFRKCELIGYGKMPLMVSAQCIQANTEHCVCGEKKLWGRGISFTDEKKRRFVSVNYCKYCYNVIYQEMPVYIKEVLEDGRRYPVRSFRYMFTTESGEEVRRVLEGKPPFETYTGHFYKGIE